MKTRRQAIILELIDREAAPQPGAAAPPAAPARLRSDAGDDFARHRATSVWSSAPETAPTSARAPTRPIRRPRSPRSSGPPRSSCATSSASSSWSSSAPDAARRRRWPRRSTRPAVRGGRHHCRRRHHSGDRARRRAAPPRWSSGSRSTRRNDPHCPRVFRRARNLHRDPLAGRAATRRSHRRHDRPRTGQGSLEEMRDRALATGALRAHVVDFRDAFARDYIVRALKAGVLGALTPVAAVARPAADRADPGEIANIEQATTVAHGDPAGAGSPLHRTSACSTRG